MWGPGMSECKIEIRSVQKIGLTDYLVEIERLSKVRFLWWSDWFSDITFYRTYNGPTWYEESTGRRALYMDDDLDGAVRKHNWEIEKVRRSHDNL